MEWWIVLSIIGGGFLLLLLSGIPIAFGFGVLNVLALILFTGGDINLLKLVAMSAYSSVSYFSFVPVPLFVLMGSVAMYSGLVDMAIKAIDMWIGRVPGRLGLITITAGAMFGACSGSSMASAATIGTLLVPEMRKRGYANWLCTGAVCAAGALAILIPPSNLMIIYAGIAGLSVGVMLIGGIIPGLMLAAFQGATIVLISKIRPQVAPPYEVESVPMWGRLLSLRHFLPLATLVVIVIGSIFLGIATPCECASLGALGAFILAAAYRKLSLRVIEKSLFATVRITGMALLIICSATVFAQVLAYTGAAAGFTQFMVGLPVPQLVKLFAMHVVVFILGCVTEPVSIMLISVPLFLPVAGSLGFDPIWFSLLLMVNIELSFMTPPFGLNLFIIKSLVPKDITMGTIYLGALPFVLVAMLAMTIMILFPNVVLWLPGLMS